MSDFNPYQPQQPYGAPQKSPMHKPKNYLVESILLLCCCAGILAIPAVIFAVQVDSKYNAGDYQGAIENSENAKKWCLIALCVAVICNLFGFVFYAIMIAVDSV